MGPPGQGQGAPALDPAREVVRRFIAAVEARRFDEALGLLSRRWRERYEAARLERDFDAEPQALRRVRRLAAALEAPVSLEGPTASLPVGEGLSAGLVLEPDGWRIDSLE
jgi:hypothetical protein